MIFILDFDAEVLKFDFFMFALGFLLTTMLRHQGDALKTLYSNGRAFDDDASGRGPEAGDGLQLTLLAHLDPLPGANVGRLEGSTQLPRTAFVHLVPSVNLSTPPPITTALITRSRTVDVSLTAPAPARGLTNRHTSSGRRGRR